VIVRLIWVLTRESFSPNFSKSGISDPKEALLFWIFVIVIDWRISCEPQSEAPTMPNDGH